MLFHGALVFWADFLLGWIILISCTEVNFFYDLFVPFLLFSRVNDSSKDSVQFDVGLVKYIS